MNFKNVLTGLLITVVIGLSFYSNVQAAENNYAGLVISPPISEKTIEAGKSDTGKFKITNPTTVDLKINITTQDFKAQGESGAQQFVSPEDNTSYSLAKWITVANSFVLKSGEEKEIPYTINVPAAAEPGGHYGVIFFTPTIDKTVEGSGALVIPQIGGLVLVNVPGTITYDAKIAEFNTAKKLYLNTTNIVDLFTRVENLGNTHFKPTGEIDIYNAFGKKIETLKLNETNGNVLPDSVRKFENAWTKKYGFGWYSAKVNLTYGPNNNNLSSSLIFWIIPWKETLIAVLLLALIIWLIRNTQLKKKS